MARTRTFLAVDINAAIRAKAEAMQKRLAECGAEVKWVTPASMHLTLLYLGDVGDSDLADVCKLAKFALRKTDSFRVTFAGLGAFPTPRRPKILWAGLSEGQAEVANLFTVLEVPLSEAGLYRKEDRPYSPHLTLGRVQDEAGSDLVAPELPKHADWTAGTIAVEEVFVMASELKRDGPEYHTLGRVPLRV
ncbi:RNA 2',3'-cyclic phosphodiesterase [soil metagenome]